MTYQTSRVVKHTRLPQGTLKRLSLSILVDHSLRWENAKKILEPPSAEKLKVIRDLVAAATGLNMERGDQLVVEAFPFEATLMAEPLTLSSPGEGPAPAPSNVPPWLQKLIIGHKNFVILAGIGATAALALIAGLMVALRRKSRKNRIAVETTPALGAAAEAKALAATPQEIERKLQEHLAEKASEKARQEAETRNETQIVGSFHEEG